MPPPVNIVGEPEVTLTYLGDETRSTEYMVRIAFVRFSLRASMQVQAPQGTSLSDWEVGTLQTVTSGAIDLNCYRSANDPSAQVVINAMVLPPGEFFSDRNPASPIFYEPAGVRSLSRYVAGQRFEINMQDTPGMEAAPFASRYTHEERDTHASLS